MVVYEQHRLQANIIQAFQGASEPAHTEGEEWYHVAHGLACALGPVERSAGVLAALSQNCSWERTVALASQALAYGHAEGALGQACEKANAILAGEHPLSVLSGPKIRAFYQLLYNPYDTEPVVIDRHAFDVAVGYTSSERERKGLYRKGVYDLFADAYRLAAANLGIIFPSQVQAVTWVQRRIDK